jgi:hypothetical protein
MPKITDLPSTSAGTATDEIPVVQSGATKRITLAALATAVAGLIGLASYMQLPSGGTAAQVLTHTGQGYDWADSATELPAQAGQAGSYLSTTGTATQWHSPSNTIAALLPPQAASAGLVLSTTGTSLQWVSPSGVPYAPDVNSLLSSPDKAAMRAVLEVQPYDPRLVTSATVYHPVIVAMRNVPAPTTGATADVATLALPSWLTRYRISSGWLIAETAAGTLASGRWTVRNGPTGTGDALTAALAGPASTAVSVSAGATAATAASYTGSTLYLHKTVNPTATGTISIYLEMMPML